MVKVQSTLILEVLGRPPEHLQEALKTLVLRLGAEKGVKILESKFNEPVKVEESKDLFTTFAELNGEFDSLEVLFGILFSYMPSHVEITYPEKMTLTNSDFNDLANKIVARMHDYDAVAKKTIAEKEILIKKLYEAAPHLFKKETPQTKEEPVKKKTKKKRSKK